MKKAKAILFVTSVWLFFFFLFGSLGFAEHFTFSIPVELNKIHPDLKEWLVTVQVTTYRVELSGSFEEIGSATRYFTVAGGNYSNIFELKFNANPGKKPEDGRKFTYFLRVKNPQTGIYTEPDLLMKKGSPYPYDSSKSFKPRGEGYLEEYR